MGVPRFLKEIDTQLYSDFLREKYKSGGVSSKVEFRSSKPTTRGSNPPPRSNHKDSLIKAPACIGEHVGANPTPCDHLRTIQKVSRLPPEHFARQYVEGRKAPPSAYRYFYFTPRFRRWVNSVLPGKFSEASLRYDEPRLIIPFLTKKGAMHAFQGRSFDPNSEAKYMTFVVDENVPLIFGLDKVNLEEDVLVLEGPIDSMFLSNAIAAAGGDLATKLRPLGNDINIIIVLDNEPRSPTTIKKIENGIRHGFKVVIWPDYIFEKDINQMIIGGKTVQQIEEIMRENTFSGLMAELKLQTWKRC
jgi:hypothetical protein